MYDEFTFAGEAAGPWSTWVSSRRARFSSAPSYRGRPGLRRDGAAWRFLDDDRFIASTVCTSAVEAFKGKTDGVGYKATADTPLVLKTGVAAATGKVQLVIFKAVAN
jgi:hypothetical protein